MKDCASQIQNINSGEFIGWYSMIINNKILYSSYRCIFIFCGGFLWNKRRTNRV